MKIKLMDQGFQPHYQANGYHNRADYIESLCEEYDPETVIALADLLGPSEDFDGLISALEDS
jgi:hypothetical protein